MSCRSSRAEMNTSSVIPISVAARSAPSRFCSSLRAVEIGPGMVHHSRNAPAHQQFTEFLRCEADRVRQDAHRLHRRKPSTVLDDRDDRLGKTDLNGQFLGAQALLLAVCTDRRSEPVRCLGQSHSPTYHTPLVDRCKIHRGADPTLMDPRPLHLFIGHADLRREPVPVHVVSSDQFTEPPLAPCGWRRWSRDRGRPRGTESPPGDRTSSAR